MPQFRPLLGVQVPDIYRLRYPLFASPKLDGVRALWFGKEFLSRTMKTIPNRTLQQRAARLNIPSGYDGELIYGPPNAKDVFRQTDSAVMSHHREIAQSMRYFVFDNCESSGNFAARLQTLSDIAEFVVRLDQTLIDHPDDLMAYEEKQLREGYEGVILRAPDGRYKQGRSTLREQYLLKLKRFIDAEATVIGFEELLHNANTASKDERGYTTRQKLQENLIPMGTLGSLVVNLGEIEFNIGTGFSEQDRMAIWQRRDEYLGKLVKFKFLPTGGKDKPRHPVFLGFRSKIDY